MKHKCVYDDNGYGRCQEIPVEPKTTYCKEQYCNSQGEMRWRDKDNLAQLCPEYRPGQQLCESFLTCAYNDSASECRYKTKNCPREVCDSPCHNYKCNPETGEFEKADLSCSDGLGCTVDQCDANGNCDFHEAVNCYDEIDMSAYPCFVAKCKEDSTSKRGYRCTRKLLHNAYIDVCGNCMVVNTDDSSTSSSVSSSSGISTVLECAEAPAKPLLQEGLAAASIALIILAAVVIGAGIAASSVIGTKTLIDRAKGANNQSAHSNPLFEETETEMTNPAFVGE